MHEIDCEWCRAQCEFGEGPKAKPDWIRTKCRGCGSLSYFKTPDPTELSRVYDEFWKSSDHDSILATGSTDKLIGDSLLDAFGWRSATGEACLDYGAGHGYFASTLSERGCKDVHAFEPYGPKPKWLDATWICNPEDLQEHRFDWVFLIEVVEHMLDPVAELRRIRTLLAPSGQLVLTTPNARGIRARLDGFQWREAQNPTHINLMSAPALEACLEQAGFSAVHRNHGPVRYIARGIRARAQFMLQRLGIDGGLRFVARPS